MVAKERPDIEMRKTQLLLRMAEDKKQLSDLEARILYLLSNSSGNILDDEVRQPDNEIRFYGTSIVNFFERRERAPRATLLYIMSKFQCTIVVDIDLYEISDTTSMSWKVYSVLWEFDLAVVN